MDIVTRLEAARDRTLKYFDLRDQQLGLSYGSGKWSVAFILHHLADAETVLFDRIRRIISEPRQVLWAFEDLSLPVEEGQSIRDVLSGEVIHYPPFFAKKNRVYAIESTEKAD